MARLKQTIATDPAAPRWHVAVDTLNIHQSEALVRYVAAVSGVTEDLGVKGKRGILATQQTRAAFLWTYQVDLSGQGALCLTPGLSMPRCISPT